MITVNVMELFLKSAELLKDGYGKVKLSKIDGNIDSPDFLSFYAVDEDTDSTINYESIDACHDGESPTIFFSPDSIAPYPLTVDELFLVAHAFQNAIVNCKTALDDKNISAELRSKIANSLKCFDSFLNELNPFLRDFQ